MIPGRRYPARVAGAAEALLTMSQSANSSAPGKNTEPLSLRIQIPRRVYLLLDPVPGDRLFPGRYLELKVRWWYFVFNEG